MIIKGYANPSELQSYNRGSSNQLVIYTNFMPGTSKVEVKDNEVDILSSTPTMIVVSKKMQILHS